MSAQQPHAAEYQPTSAERLQEAVSEVYQNSCRQLAGVLELATLEARYSGLMLAAVLGLAVVIAVTALIAWGLLAAAAVAGMITHGWSWAAALTVVALLHLGAGFMALLLLRRCITRIGLDSTCEALGLAAPHVSE